MEYPRVEVKEEGDRIVFSIPKELISEGILDPEQEYEAIIAPKESFKKGFKVSMDATENVGTKKDGSSPFQVVTTPCSSTARAFGCKCNRIISLENK